MNDQQLTAELARLDLPGSEAALERCLSAYRASSTRPSLRQPRRFGLSVRLRFAIAVLSAGAVVAFSLTPPGRAATDWAAELIGIADVGEAPTVPPAPTEGFEPRPPRATVIASGLTARGDPFEWVVEGTRRGPCLLVQFPARRASEGGGFCGRHIFLPLRGADLMLQGEGGHGSGESVFNGFVSADVASVKLTIERDGRIETVDAITEQIPARLLRKVDADKPRGVFIAFPPLGPPIDHVAATAYDAQGDPLDSTSRPTFPP